MMLKGREVGLPIARVRAQSVLKWAIPIKGRHIKFK